MFEKLKKIIKDDWEGYSSLDKKMMLVMTIVGIILILGAVGINMFWEESNGYGEDIGAAEILDEDVNEEKNELSSKTNEDIAQNKDKTPKEIEREKIQRIKKWERKVEIGKPNRIIQKPMLDPTSSEIFTELKPLPIENSLDTVDIKLKNSDMTHLKTTELTEEIIDRLKAYECYKLTGDEKVSPTYMSFKEMYKREKNNCEGYHKWFHPARINDYRYGKITWISSPKLIYKTPQLHTSIRGVLQIKYLRANNKYNLYPNTWYERDVEYWFSHTTDGKFLTKIIYLSNWKGVK